MERTAEVTRNYKDLFSYKKFVQSTMIPKYFPDEDISTLNVGLMGLVTEQTGIVIEDTFNAVSTMLREFFPNKAIFPESVYTYAGLFQLSNMIGKASKCKFLMIISEAELLKIFEQSALANGYATDNVYISKNTTIYLEDLPFVLDYDIEITRKRSKLLASQEWVYGAKYMITPYKNSISDIVNPYIKIRKSMDGYLALEVVTHQCVRIEPPEERIVDNSNLNYTTIDVQFPDTLAGFDVFYRNPSDEEWIQLDCLVINSLPQSDPFCYYRITDENLLQISFAMSSSYFQPEFNSEVRVVAYSTKGKFGRFDQYTGSDVTIVPDTESYQYNDGFIVTALPATGSAGGEDAITIEELRKDVCAQFSTAKALTTDHDLETHFYDYERNNANNIKFIKRRDDLWERLYTGFLIMRNQDYIYPANTLDVSTNYTYWDNADGGYIFTLDPGHVFEYETNGRVKMMYKPGVMDRKEFYNFQGQSIFEWIYRDYFKWLEIVEPMAVVGFDENDRDWEENWHHSKTSGHSFKEFIENELYTCQDCGYHTHELVSVGDTEEEQNLCPCCHGKSLIKGNLKVCDFFATVYDNDERYAKKISNGEFLFSNPFLMSITRNPGLLNYYLTVINQTSLLDFIDYNHTTPLQFIINQVNVYRNLERDREYTVRLKMMPSIEWEPEYLVPGITLDKYVGRRSQVKNNYVRIFMVIQNAGTDICYTEMVPEEYNSEEQFVYACRFRVNDHVSMAQETQIVDYTIEELGYIPDDIGDVTATEFTFNEEEITNILVSEQGVIVEGSSNGDDENDPTPPTTEGDLIPPMEDTSGIRGNFVFIENQKTRLIPMTNVILKFVVVSKEYGVEDSMQITNNYPNNREKFRLPGYQWTNVYDTSTDRIDLIKPLSMVRSSMYYRDDRLYNIQSGDMYLYSVPFVKYSMLQHYNMTGKEIKDSSGFTNKELFTTFIQDYFHHYETMELVLASTLKNVSHIDIKFYNTYGRSKNYIIGDSDEIIDRVNMSICFYVYVTVGTDMVKAQSDLKSFIKDQIETLNKNGNNGFNISNLQREIENNFAYVDHTKFIGMNGEVINGEYKKTQAMGYGTDYQSIKSIAVDIDTLDRDDRFAYVPEMLCINKDQISLVMFED